MNIAVDKKTRGLLRQALAEAIGGFAARRFPASEKPEAEALWRRVENEETMVLTDEDLRFVLKVLEFALKELGPEEFHTITGYGFDFGVATAESFQTEIASANYKSEN